jgi:hypothetical protein
MGLAIAGSRSQLFLAISVRQSRERLSRNSGVAE